MELIRSHDFLERLLRTRFGELPANVHEHLAADAETLERWGQRVLTASSLDEGLAGG